jgi:hypothetical protein
VPFEDKGTQLPPPPFEFEWQVARWCQLPSGDRKAFVEELARLMGRLAIEEELDEEGASGNPAAP